MPKLDNKERLALFDLGDEFSLVFVKTDGKVWERTYPDFDALDEQYQQKMLSPFVSGLFPGKINSDGSLTEYDDIDTLFKAENSPKKRTTYHA